MSVEYNSQSYTTGKGILLYPDHYVNAAVTFKKGDSNAVDVNGRKIIKAGTIYPANDATAKGVVWADYDITNGDVTGALIIHGFIKTSAIPVAPSEEAKAVLPMIAFAPEAN